MKSENKEPVTPEQRIARFKQIIAGLVEFDDDDVIDHRDVLQVGDARTMILSLEGNDQRLEHLIRVGKILNRTQDESTEDAAARVMEENKKLREQLGEAQWRLNPDQMGK